jgi:beta-lactamase regulating signal transducer with metallopeptidase domain
MGTINNWFLIFLGNALWQALVIMVAALSCARLMRNAPARQHHFLWIAALALCLLIPLLGSSGLLRSKEQTLVMSNVIASRMKSGSLAPNPPSSPALSDFFSVSMWTRYTPPILAILALAGYWLSLLFHGIRMWRSWSKTKALLAASDERAIPEPLASIRERCERAFGLRNVTLLYSSEIGSPITAGKRSIILSAELFDSQASDLLSAAIGHEMAHIKRRDFAFNLTYELLSMLLAFHPAVIFIKRRIKETRELACDELVTEKLLDAPAYARSLLQLADSAMAFNRPVYTLGIFETEILEERIMKLIEQRPCLSQASKTFILIAVLSILTASSAVAAVFSRSLEQGGTEQNNIALEQDGEEQIIKMSFNGGGLPIANVHARNAPFKVILGSLGRHLKLDVTFDDSAKDLRISIDIEQLPAGNPVEVRKVIDMIFQKKELKAKLKDDHTLFIFADTPVNREKYAGMKSWP